MPDYKEMYLKLFRATEAAANLLIAAQQECEEMVLSAPEPELKVISLPRENTEQYKFFGSPCVIIVP